MPTAAPADQAIAAWWRDQLKSSSVKSLRIQEAIMAALLGPEGVESNGTITVDLPALGAIAERGLHLEAEGNGASLRIYVVDANGNEVKPEPHAYVSSGAAYPEPDAAQVAAGL